MTLPAPIIRYADADVTAHAESQPITVSGVHAIPDRARTSHSAVGALAAAVSAELGVEAADTACALMEEGLLAVLDGFGAHLAARVTALGILHLEPRIGLRTSGVDRPTRPAIPFGALRLVVGALRELDESIRARLATTSVHALQYERAGRAVRSGLLTLAVADRMPPCAISPTTLAVAAMAQEMLDDHVALEDALAALRAAAEVEHVAPEEISVAREAMQIRRCVPPADLTVAGRLVALTCEEARPSLVDAATARAIEIPIEIDVPIELDDDAERISVLPSDVLDEIRESLAQRDSIELPTAAGDGRSTLALTPLAHVLLAARNRKLTGTLVLIGSEGDKHAIVFEQGVPVHARTRMLAQPLGWVLCDLGFVEQAQLPEALSRAAQSGRQLGAQLVADGMLSPARLEEALSAQLAARIGSMSMLPGDTQVEFFAHHDLLKARADRPSAPCPPEVALLAIARKMPVERLWAILDRLGDGRIDVHVSVASRMRPTVDEWDALAHLEALQYCKRGLFVDDVLSDPMGAPLVVALTLMGEVHPRVQRCRRCARRR